MSKVIILFLSFALLVGCAQPGLVKETQPALGTLVEITVADKQLPSQSAKHAIGKAFAEIKRIEDLLSRFKPESDISRINTDAYIRPTRVNSEIISLLEKAISFSRLSNGAFDITVRPLMELWGLTGKKKKYLPSAQQINQALDGVGYQYIDINKHQNTVFLARRGMSLDLGGIAKGYAADRAISALKQEGIKNALVNAGGDIYALGMPQEQKSWRIALRHPRRKGSALTVLELKDQACATSGDYENFVEIAGKRYSHIINPKSGYPCEEVPASVTVLAKDCLTADVLATSIFVLGPEAGINLVNQFKNTEAIVASWQNNKLDILLSQGLKRKLKFTP